MKKILWIDDDVGTLESQKRFLENAGYEVEPIRDVDKAMTRIRGANEGSLGIILDIMMQTGELLLEKPTNGGLRTGREFLKLLNEDKPRVKLKIFVYTVIDDPVTRDFCAEIGISFYRKTTFPGKKLVDLATEEFGAP